MNVLARRRMDGTLPSQLMCLICVLFGTGNGKDSTHGTTTESQYQVRRYRDEPMPVILRFMYPMRYIMHFLLRFVTFRHRFALVEFVFRVLPNWVVILFSAENYMQVFRRIQVCIHLDIERVWFRKLCDFSVRFLFLFLKITLPCTCSARLSMSVTLEYPTFVKRQISRGGNKTQVLS